jgi:hypothetical protein
MVKQHGQGNILGKFQKNTTFWGNYEIAKILKTWANV